MLVCVLGLQGTEMRLGQSDHPLLLVYLHHPFSLGLLGLILSSSWANDCTSAAFLVFHGTHSSPSCSHSIVGMDLVSSLGGCSHMVKEF